MAVAGTSVTVAYYLRNQAALDAAGAVSIVDGAVHVAAHLDELNADPQVTSITLSGVGGNVLTLTLAQALNDTHALAALAKPFSIAVTSSAGAIEALTAGQFAQLSASGVTQFKATDHDVDLTAAQMEALGAANLAIVQPYSGGSVEVIRYQPNGLLASVSYRGIVGQPYTDYTVSYGSDGKPTSATYSNGMTASYTYLSNGSYDVAVRRRDRSALHRLRDALRLGRQAHHGVLRQRNDGDLDLQPGRHAFHRVRRRDRASLHVLHHRLWNEWCADERRLQQRDDRDSGPTMRTGRLRSTIST